MNYLWCDRIRQLEQTVEWLEVRLRRLEDGGADPIYVQPGIPPWTRETLKGDFSRAVRDTLFAPDDYRTLYALVRDTVKEILADSLRLTDAEIRAIMSGASWWSPRKPNEWSPERVAQCRRAAEEAAP